MEWNNAEWLAVIVAFISIVVGNFVTLTNVKAVQEGEHGKWLREKQREAYIEFLATTRRAYDSISRRDKDRATLEAASLVVGAKEKFETERASEIDRQFVEVKQAQAVLDIVGPLEMAVLGRHVGARLRLDRWLTSLRLENQLLTETDEILQQAEETGNIRLYKSLRKAIVPGPADRTIYEEVLRQHRLDDFWEDFTLNAGKTLRKPVSRKNGAQERRSRR